MRLVLLAAGIGSLYPLKQLGTGLLLILLTLFNAVEGLQQEGKAAAAVAALQKMVMVKANRRPVRLHRHVPRGQHLQHRPGHTTAPAADVVGELHHAVHPVSRARLQQTRRRSDGPPAAAAQPADPEQWLICTVVTLSIVVAAEIRKAVLRRTATKAIHPPGAPPAAVTGIGQDGLMSGSGG
jgi:hypothetical protein